MSSLDDHAGWLVAHWTRQAHLRNTSDSDARYGPPDKQKSECDAALHNNPGVTKGATNFQGAYRSEVFEIDIETQDWRDSLRTWETWESRKLRARIRAAKTVSWARK